MIVNDPSIESYNSAYETKTLRWNTKGSREEYSYVRLNKKS